MKIVIVSIKILF